MASTTPPAQRGNGANAVREIAFNYTSADDRQAVHFLLGPDVLRKLDELRSRRVTGRSARLMMRVLGEVFIHRRNPYLFQEVIDSEARRRRFFGNVERDLGIIERNAQGETRVLDVVAACRTLLDSFRREIEATPETRKRIQRALGAIVGSKNVLFDPFSLVSHATDATDWRLHLPIAVVTPDDERQLPSLLPAIARLGLKAIPRGAGTGITGGAVPLRPGCVVINTEKLNRVRGIADREFVRFDGLTVTAKTLEVEAGVITEHAMDYAAERGQVFATDPTSAWASTIGGNIAENAGGKMAVRWGTCIDSLLEWRIAMPSGSLWTVRRTDHRLRKIFPEDTVTFEVADERGETVWKIELAGTEIRKQGLWKDITNKALKGLPGIQKEGTDGVITSAIFVLYPEYESKQTLCLEFFGPDMDEASRVILELSRAFPFPADGGEALLALEHFDDEYVRAIDYKVKAARAETPKAVLLIDIAAHRPEDVQSGTAKIKALLEHHPNTDMFVARSDAEAQRFWSDRKKLGAIARRTNAFKLNEDIVIPLESLAEFSRFIDELNIEEERFSQARFADRAEMIIRDAIASNDGEFAAKLQPAQESCARAKLALHIAEANALRSLAVLTALRSELAELSRGYPEVLAALERVHAEVRNRRIVLATHMHAGDGNVHVNVPVLSNDRAMLDRADEVIDRVMEKVVRLGGVVSGEHGIGITKLKYLERARVDELAEYRQSVDPQGLMNPGKLEDFGVLNHVFTPSFNLLELEARILQYGQLQELSSKIAHCVRCGKCKADCCVFYPARGMFYHPRNKNLAIGSLIEALLYDAQRERSTHFRLLEWLEEVADHCTICHKCLKPCPVQIDTGEVSVLEREIMASWGYKRTPAITSMTLQYLDSRSSAFNKIFHTAVVRAGGAAQRVASKLLWPLQSESGAASSFYPLKLLRSSLPPAPSQTLRDVLPRCEADQALVFEPAEDAVASVFYFPGCGSERLQSAVSMAAIHLMLEVGVRVVLPPPFLCCGFPAHANAKTDLHSRQVLRDTILLTQIREMFAHLDFDACIVTCGTCREGLQAMEAGKIFGGRLVDVAQYAYERGLRVSGNESAYYHTPCHDSLDGTAQKLAAAVGGFASLTTVPHCCSEAGTMALSRPDISDAMLQRKREAIKETVNGTPAVILTNCPSCMQGLGRNRGIGVEAVHLAVALARKHSGENWIELFRAQAAKAINITF